MKRPEEIAAEIVSGIGSISIRQGSISSEQLTLANAIASAIRKDRAQLRENFCAEMKRVTFDYVRAGIDADGPHSFDELPVRAS